MTSPAQRLADWNRCVAELIETLDQPCLVERLMGSLRVLAPVDDLIITLVFRAGSAPRAVFERPPSATTRRSIERYLSGPYLLDPYYRAGVEGRPSGFYRLATLAPDGFRRSEYYRSYYARTRLRDEVGYLVQVSSACFLNLSLERSASPPFSRVQIGLLEAVAPVVVALAARHWRGPHAVTSADPRLRIDGALAELSRGRLTPREMEVTKLVLEGYSGKAAAVALGISPETVKLHRKNLYAKLAIRSQSELFSRFLAALGLSDAGSRQAR